MPSLSLDVTPGSALFSALQAFFQFLATPEGQNVCACVRTEVADLVKLFHKNSGAAAEAAAEAPQKTA